MILSCEIFFEKIYNENSNELFLERDYISLAFGLSRNIEAYFVRKEGRTLQNLVTIIFSSSPFHTVPRNPLCNSDLQ